MKIMLQILLVIFFFLFSAEHTYARRPKSDPAIEQTFLHISHLIFDQHIEAIAILDSLEKDFLEEDYQVYAPYIDYIYGYIAYKKGNYSKSMLMMESALERFMYQSKDEWSTKCMLLLANSAEITRLFTEAITLYEKAMDFATTDRSMGAAYMGLARNQKRIGKEWKATLNLGIEKYQNSGLQDLKLYARMIPYWFTQDSADIIDVMPQIAQNYQKIGFYTREADAYKCLAIYYQKQKEYDKSLHYLDLSIACLTQDIYPAKTLLSSIYHLKANILHSMEKEEESLKNLQKAINLNIETNCRGNNYDIYRYLHKLEKDKKNYAQACLYSNRMLLNYQEQTKSKIQTLSHIFRILRKVELLEEEMLKLKRQSNNRIYVSSFLLFVIFLTIVLWLRSNNKAIKRKNAEIESKNSKLMVETGDLLEKVSQEHHKAEILNSHKEIESKVDRIFSHDKIVSSGLKDKYAETLLIFDIKLKILTSTERRYAAMIALGVPYKSIANLLSVQPGTVAQYRNRIRKKLGISNTTIDLEDHLKTYIEQQT